MRWMVINLEELLSEMWLVWKIWVVSWIWMASWLRNISWSVDTGLPKRKLGWREKKAWAGPLLLVDLMALPSPNPKSKNPKSKNPKCWKMGWREKKAWAGPLLVDLMALPDLLPTWGAAARLLFKHFFQTFFSNIFFKHFFQTFFFKHFSNIAWPRSHLRCRCSAPFQTAIMPPKKNQIGFCFLNDKQALGSKKNYLQTNTRIANSVESSDDLR